MNSHNQSPTIVHSGTRVVSPTAALLLHITTNETIAGNAVEGNLRLRRFRWWLI